MRSVIQGLWIGSELSVMERMSIASFVANGHDYHLYVYTDVNEVPRGATVKDASAILPASMIFEYRDYKSFSGFSNFFRYKLLLEKGGWWADTDMICIKPFDFEDEYIFSSEMNSETHYITSGVIKAPAESPAMAYAWDVCRNKDTNKLLWGETGPRLVAQAVKQFSLERFVKPYKTFCPVGFMDWQSILEPGADLKIDESTRAIHLWNEMWRRAGADKNQQYHPDCLYEKLRRTYLSQ